MAWNQTAWISLQDNAEATFSALLSMRAIAGTIRCQALSGSEADSACRARHYGNGILQVFHIASLSFGLQGSDHDFACSLRLMARRHP